jgi:transcription-repair coupling factor (superfamily II helicase)
VGFDLYNRLLQDTIRELQGEPAEEARPTKIALTLSTFIHEEYVEEINQRLTFYKKIADASSEDDLEEIADELRERFGPLPEPALHLIWAARLKLLGEQADVKNLDWKSAGLEIAFHPQCSVPPEKIISLLSKAPPGSTMAGEDRLRWAWSSPSLPDRFTEAIDLLRSLR